LFFALLVRPVLPFRARHVGAARIDRHKGRATAREHPTFAATAQAVRRLLRLGT